MELKAMCVEIKFILMVPDIVDFDMVLIEFAAVIRSNTGSVRIVAAILWVEIVVLSIISLVSNIRIAQAAKLLGRLWNGKTDQWSFNNTVICWIGGVHCDRSHCGGLSIMWFRMVSSSRRKSMGLI